MMLKQYAYLPVWFLKSCILKKRRPLQTVLFVTDHCNLRCRHCTAAGHAGVIMKTYEAIRKELLYAYRQGARFVDFEGGEPTLWRDREKTLNDLVRLSKQLGFFSATVTTNGQLPLKDCAADTIWVSVDGCGDTHDMIRGVGTFEKLDRTIRECGHPSVCINMVINNLNRDAVKAVAAYARDNPAIRSVSMNFHTPYLGTEELMLPWEERCRTINEILSLKRQGYPVMNSRSGLTVMKQRQFKKDCWVSSFILADGTRLSECPGRTLGVCRDCGFCMAGEMYSVLRLKPDTLSSGMKLRMTTNRTR